MGDFIKPVEKLVDHAPLAMIVLGIFVFILGAAGGLPIGDPPLQISDPAWRIGLGILGILLAIAGLMLQFREPTGRKDNPVGEASGSTTGDQLSEAAKRIDEIAGEASGSIADDQPTYQVHKYSGTWIIHTSFSRWRGKPINEPDKVSFDGRALLVIPSNGEGGVGVQVGKLVVRVDKYHATYEIVNEVQSTSVYKDKTDHREIFEMQVKVIRRILVDEDPPAPKDPGAKDPYADLRRPLVNPNFPIKLKPADDTPRLLEGFHDHEDSSLKDQIASEKYIHTGLFGPPGL